MWIAWVLPRFSTCGLTSLTHGQQMPNPQSDSQTKSQQHQKTGAQPFVQPNPSQARQHHLQGHRENTRYPLHRRRHWRRLIGRVGHQKPVCALSGPGCTCLRRTWGPRLKKEGEHPASLLTMPLFWRSKNTLCATEDGQSSRSSRRGQLPGSQICVFFHKVT